MNFHKHFAKNYSTYLSVSLILIFATSLWYLQIQQQKDFLHYQTSIHGEDLIVKMSSEVDDRLNTLDLLKETWLQTDNPAGLYNYSRYLKLVPSFFNLTTGFLAINWIDDNGTIRWIYPYEQNAGALNQNIRYFINGEFNEAFAYAEATREMGVTGLIPLFQGGFGIALYAPLIYQGNITGYFNGVFGITTLLHALLEGNSSITGINDFSFQFYNNATLFFAHGEDFNLSHEYTHEYEIDLLGTPVCVYIHPNQILQKEVTSFSSYQILFFGATLSAVIGVLMHLIKKKVDIIEENASEKEELMEILNVKQKMTSLGTLAGGIAHDFNNILAGIQGSSTLLGMNLRAIREKYICEHSCDVDLIDESIEFIRDVEELIDRSTQLNKRIISFSRSSDSDFQLLDINQVLLETVEAVQSMIDKRIQILTEVSPEQALLIGDPSFFSQILTNLIINARDAIKGLGTIRITSHLLPQPEHQALSPVFRKTVEKIAKTAPVEEINSVYCLKIADTGEGIPLEIQGKIFDPFFSTKKREGKGLGLGLAIVYNHVMQMGGKINLESHVGEGTEFSLTFPAFLPKNKLLLEALKAKKEPVSPPDYSSLTIIIVEDEEPIRKTLKTFFSKAHASVWTAKNGKKGLDIISQYASQFSLAILDINMPEMNGVELYHAIKELRRDLPILFITGYTAIDLPDQNEFDLGVLYKPFDVADLAEKLAHLQTGVGPES